MTSPSLLLPVRIPELGPSLGKLITGTRGSLGRVPLDSLRSQLATEIIEHAGEARRLVANEERDAAISALGREEWLAAWESAVNKVAEILVDRLADHLEAEAIAVNMPSRLRSKIALDPTERRALTARIGSAGAELIPALDEVDRWAARARTATARDRDAMERWQSALTGAGRRLESAWLALEQSVDAELDRWLEVADQVSRWRRPMWPVWVTGAVGTALAVWLGLIRGGVIATPAWMVNLFRLAGLE